MTKPKIWLSSPHMGGEEMKFIQEAFDTNWISPVGPHITAFEKELASYTGVKACAALSSGTAAIHLALIIMGITTGDEVICQSFTFSASCNPILYQGAKPVFIDSETETWNMDPVALRLGIEDRIKVTGKKPKAIIVVHLYGMPAKMDEIMNIAHAFEIPVIEDAAEALGSVYKGKKCGSIGDVGILSFNGNKIITTSGGGALLSNNEQWIERARYFATQARDPAPHYEHSQVGYNYRLSNVSAGIGRGQLQVLDQRVQQRRLIFEKYRSSFGGIGSIQLLDEPKDLFSNRWLTTILINKNENYGPNREDLRLLLEKANIESRPLWKPMNMQPVFQKYPFYGTGVAQNLFVKGLCLPSGSNLEDSDQQEVISLIVGVVT